MTGTGPAITAHYDTSSVKPAALHTDMEAIFDYVQFSPHRKHFSLLKTFEDTILIVSTLNQETCQKRLSQKAVLRIIIHCLHVCLQLSL